MCASTSLKRTVLVGLAAPVDKLERLSCAAVLELEYMVVTNVYLVLLMPQDKVRREEADNVLYRTRRVR